MSLNLIGRREKPKRKHRADDRIAELEAANKALRGENAKLLNRQAEADDYFALLKNDVDTTNQAWQQEKQRRVLAQERIVELLEECAEWRVDARTLSARLAPYLAAEANANKVTVPPMVRDTTDPADQATQPIPVITPVVPLHKSPPANPVHIPAWAGRGETATQ